MAGSVLYAWARLRGAKAPDRRHWATTTVAGGLLLLGGNGSVVWAEQRVASGLAALLVATVPVWMVLLDTMMRGAPWPGRRAGAGLVLGFAGMALLASPSGTLGGRQVDPWGVAVLVGGSISWAVGSIYSRMARMPESLLATGMEMLSGGALLLSAGLVSGEVGRFSADAVTPVSLLAFLYLIVFGSLVGFNAYIFLLGHTTPARATTYAYVNPVVALFLGWFIAGEPVTRQTVFSAAVIVIGVALIVTGQRGGRGDPATELRP